MHMNSAPHLLSEDREDYERILDNALRAAPHRPEFALFHSRIGHERLRTMALEATETITSAAAAEYQRYVKLRDAVPALPARRSGPLRDMGRAVTSGGDEFLAAHGGAASGAGLVAVLATLAPVLAGAAAAIFLLVGYALRLLSPQSEFGKTLLSVGWVFAVITAISVLLAGIGLLVIALRNGSTSLRAEAPNRRRLLLEEAHEAWRHALVERGVVPFVKQALTELDTQEPQPAEPTGRIPHLGYDKPGFTSPDEGQQHSVRPRYTSPDFTSPDFDVHDWDHPGRPPHN
jgi:hypothetical protein